MSFPTVLGPSNGIIARVEDSGLGYQYATIEFDRKLKYVELAYFPAWGFRGAGVANGVTTDMEVVPAIVGNQRSITSVYAYANSAGTLLIHDSAGTVLFEHEFTASGIIHHRDPNSLFYPGQGESVEVDWDGAGDLDIQLVADRPAIGLFFVINNPNGLNDILSMMGEGFPFELDKMGLLSKDLSPVMVRVPESDNNTIIHCVGGVESLGDQVAAKALSLQAANTALI